MDSNDTLYGGDSKFLSEISKLCETVIAQILDHLKTLGKEEVCPYFNWIKCKAKITLELSKWTAFLARFDLLGSSGSFTMRGNQFSCFT